MMVIIWVAKVTQRPGEGKSSWFADQRIGCRFDASRCSRKGQTYHERRTTDDGCGQTYRPAEHRIKECLVRICARRGRRHRAKTKNRQT